MAEQPADIPIAAQIDEEIAQIQALAIDFELQLEILRGQLQVLKRVRSRVHQEPVSQPEEDILPVPLRPKQAIRRLLGEKPGLKTGQVISRLRGRVQTRSKDFSKAIYAALSQMMKVGELTRDDAGRWRLVVKQEDKD